MRASATAFALAALAQEADRISTPRQALNRLRGFLDDPRAGRDVADDVHGRAAYLLARRDILQGRQRRCCGSRPSRWMLSPASPDRRP
jgi:hypothetical protein